MKPYYVLILAAFTGITACGPKEQTSKKLPRPVKSEIVASRNEITKEYAGVVEAVNYAQLAFRVGGQIIEIPVVEGQQVKKGDLIAAIDTRDLALQYSADKSTFETATAQLERNKRLLSKQAISQQEYEISQSNFQRAKSAYDLSSNNMRDARLVSPFAGSIERKLVENYQRVTSGTPIVQLINTNDLRIRFVVPDNDLMLLKASKKQFEVEFSTIKGISFKAVLNEYLEASPNGSGIPVTIIIDDPTFNRSIYEIKPGFSCNITLKTQIDEYLENPFIWVPLSAVFVDPLSNQKCVWTIGADNRIALRHIKVLGPTGDSYVIVSEGLKNKERVVTAGVHRLVDGEEIREIE